MRDRTFESQFYRASGLNLLINAIVYWNTLYLEQAFADLNRDGIARQFGRALYELNIDIICANTPQAKERTSRCTLLEWLSDNQSGLTAGEHAALPQPFVPVFKP